MESFESYSIQHLGPILFYIGFTWLTIRIGRRLSTPRAKQLIALVHALACWAIMFAGDVSKMIEGTYSVKEDLPLFLCRLVAWVLPVTIMFMNKKILKMMYFFVLAGTLQAVLTPDLAEGFPSYLYFRYWILHLGLISTMIYVVSVFELRITWKDLWRAFLVAQPYLLILMLINSILGSNYGYTQHKPPGGSVLDFFGPWPWYIVGAEAIMLISFVLLIIPFLFRKKKSVEVV